MLERTVLVKTGAAACLTGTLNTNGRTGYEALVPADSSSIAVTAADPALCSQ